MAGYNSISIFIPHANERGEHFLLGLVSLEDFWVFSSIIADN